MKSQAVRRSPRYLRLRAWWRGLDLATQADALFLLGILAGWMLLPALALLMFAPGGAR